MNRINPSSSIYIDVSKMDGAGRGVFAQTLIPEGSLIEQCPVVALPEKKDRARLRKTGLVNYYFLWGERKDHAAICLGWGAVYNHSFSPNARFEKVSEETRLDFYALRDIQPGEEITVNYNGVPDNHAPLLIPGIPAHAGGMQPSRFPRFVTGITRRVKLLARYFLANQTSIVVLATATAF